MMSMAGHNFYWLLLSIVLLLQQQQQQQQQQFPGVAVVQAFVSPSRQQQQRQRQRQRQRQQQHHPLKRRNCCCWHDIKTTGWIISSPITFEESSSSSSCLFVGSKSSATFGHHVSLDQKEEFNLDDDDDAHDGYYHDDNNNNNNYSPNNNDNNDDRHHHRAASSWNSTGQEKDWTFYNNKRIRNLAIHSAKGNRTAAVAAQAILEEMRDTHGGQHGANGSPDTVTYQTVLAAYAKSRRPDSAIKAEEIAYQMITIHQQQVEEWKRIFGDSSSSSNDDNDDNDNEKSDSDDGIPSYYQEYVTPVSSGTQLLHPLLQQQLREPYSPDLMSSEGSTPQTHDPTTGLRIITVKPNYRTYSTVMDAWGRKRSREGAERAEAWLERFELLHRANPNDAALQPNTITYNTMMNAWAKSQTGVEGAERAAEWLEVSLSKNLTDPISYNNVMHAWARSKLPNAGEMAEEVLRSMPPGWANDVSYSTVIDAWSRSEGPNCHLRALRLLKELEDLYAATADEPPEIRKECGVCPNTICYSTVIHAVANSKEPDKATVALKLLRHMQNLFRAGVNVKVQPSRVTYNNVLNAFATTPATSSSISAKLMGQVKALFQEMVDSGSGSSSSSSGDNANNYAPDQYTYGTVLKACSHHLDPYTSRDDEAYIKHIFDQACAEGQVSFGVCFHLRAAAPPHLYRTLLASAIDPETGHFDLHQMPKEWKKRVKGERKFRGGGGGGGRRGGSGGQKRNNYAR